MSIVEQDILRHQYIEEVAAYIRVSTTEQKLHGLSLESQENLLRSFAEKNNMKIVGWYRDEGVSGRKLIRKRPELQRMIQDAERKKFKRIIFIKLDRFFRSVAEYHECMKRLSTGGVIWTATEEKYDLSTASGEAFVNMKLTMAQFEADQAGERIRMVNEYKVKTGQPLYGTRSLPFCFKVSEPSDGERHKYIAKDNEDITRDLIDHVMKSRSIRGSMMYINKKYGTTFGYGSVVNALRSELLCGTYRGNPNYCEPYMTSEQWEELQEIIKRTPRTSPGEHVYIFTGLIKCPDCGGMLAGGMITNTHNRNGKRYKYRYYGYRCNKYHKDRTCTFPRVVFENRMESELLEHIEGIIADKKAKVISMRNDNHHVSKYDIDALQQELSRLNYSWQKGRIKSVEEYDKRYDALIEQIEAAHSEMNAANDEPDYEKVQQIFSADWKEMYNALDDEHKRAFWRSFVEEIRVEWTTKVKRIVDIKFF